MRTLLTIAALASLLFVSPTFAVDPESKPGGPNAAAPEPDAATKENYEKFERLLKGVTLKGRFTVLGKDGTPKEESYDIVGVEKSPLGDYWVFKAVIKYGGKSLPMEFPLEVKWAGKTPVITLNNLTIPNMGTFDARVMFHENMYVGTWRHGEAGGHMWGTFAKTAAQVEPAPKK